VVIRNPLRAMLAYFNELYAKNSYSLFAGTSRSAAGGGEGRGVSSAEASREAWVNCRDSELTHQLMPYRRFMSFWMEKYLGANNRCMYFLYKDLVRPEMGAQEAL